MLQNANAANSCIGEQLVAAVAAGMLPSKKNME
jgi:hypothetical protein